MKDYKLGLPFDNVNIIVKSIMGSPRFIFDLDEDEKEIIAYNFKNEKIFKISDGVSVNHIFAEKSLISNNINEFNEYGKLFYEYGSGLLTELAIAIIRSGNNCKYTLGFTNEDAYSIRKLGIAFNKNFNKFQTLIGLRSGENENRYIEHQYHLNFSKIIDDVEFMLKNSNKDNVIEFGDILSVLYGALTIYLTGVFINLSEKLGVNIPTIYGDGSSYTFNDLSDRLIKSTVLEEEQKYKLISLIYFYYLLTEFYKNYSGVDFIDKFNRVFYEIGKKLSNIEVSELEKEMDISYLFANNVENCDDLYNILRSPSVIKSPTSFDYILRDSDITDFGTIALPIFKYFDYSAEFGEDKPKINSSCYFNNLIEGEATHEEADILYNHFIDNVVNVIPSSISPKYFYKITVYASAFRKLKKSSSAKIKKLGALGLYQAEAVLTLLYKEWVKCENYCRPIGTGILCKDDRYVSKSVKAKLYIKMSLQNYSNYVRSDVTEDDYYAYNSSNLYFRASMILDTINTNGNIDGEFMSLVKEIDIDNYDYIDVDSNNYERFDENIKKLNKCILPLTAFVSSPTNENFGYKFIIENIETDYQQKTIDKLVEYANKNEFDYPSIFDCKLARALVNNIDEILKNEKSEERFDMYFNIFIKNIIPVSLAKNIMDKTDNSEEDFVGNQKPDEKYLPNIKSQRLFNFLER